MLSLAGFCYRRRRLVLLAWIVVLVATIATGGALPADHEANYQTPGAESSAAYEVLGAHFPARSGDSLKLVFQAEAGVDDPATRAAVEGVLAEVSEMEHVSGILSPYSPEGASLRAADGVTAYAEVDMDITADRLVPEVAKPMVEAAEAGEIPGVEMAFTTLVAEMELGSEALGLIFAALVLLLAFGSLLAMGLPIMMALFGLGIGATLGGIASRVVETPDWAATVATMIGLGVGIDYALFIITRYRTALAGGLEPQQAVMEAMGTAGRAVLFAGTTVVISLLGMLTMGLGYLHGVVTSAVVAVLAVLAASLTLLPAMLGFAGRAIDRLRVPFTGRGSGRAEQAFWYRWSRIVQRRPWPAFVGGAAVLLVLTIPLAGLRFGFPDDGNSPEGQPAKESYEMLRDGFGPGYNGALLLVADLAGSTGGEAVLADLSARAAALDGVSSATPAIPSPDGQAAIITVYPDTGPQDVATEHVVRDLRDDVVPAAVGASGVVVRVGGFTAISIDQSRYIGDRLPLFIGAVVLLSFLLLTSVFRSLLVALKAAVMNLLSIAAAYGVMAYAVQGGWFGDLLGIPETPVPAFVPMIMFAILFGLSMDYEVFLLSRIREEYLRTGDNGQAVADGLAATARVITAAAAIMVFVFGVFIFDPNAFIKQIGLGLATAVLVDATVVRMVLVPATMELLGDRNWWLPGWLDRLLPNLHVEGQHVEAAPVAPGEQGEPVGVGLS